jgi:outer membrane protein OmpA-like peptidoglycan-associated protein
MRPFGPFALAAMAAALTACASPQAAPSPSAKVAAQPAPIAVAPIAPPLSEYDSMRAALPGFDLQQRAGGPGSNVSVVRDLVFETNSSILSMPQVKRLVPLQAYLRANPRTSVRVEGNGDGANTTERDTDLAMSRAQAVVRALLTDMMVANKIVASSAPMPQSAQHSRRADITFVTP